MAYLSTGIDPACRSSSRGNSRSTWELLMRPVSSCGNSTAFLCLLTYGVLLEAEKKKHAGAPGTYHIFGFESAPRGPTQTVSAAATSRPECLVTVYTYVKLPKAEIGVIL